MEWAARTLWSSCLVAAVLLEAGYCFKYRQGLRSPPINADEELPPDEWFTQRLDHFEPTDTRTWQQRYFTNDSFRTVRRNGPVFLMIGGEGEATPAWMVKGAWIDYAQKYQALCFQLEHRFYGKSHPTPDMSVDNLKYLSSEQALADLAYFIESMNRKYKLTLSNKWVVFGGSYPGSLAAWMRVKYPHLVHAAISTSGPLLAKIDFREYFEVVRNSLDTFGGGCSNTVHEASKKVENLLRSKDGVQTLVSKMKLCDVIDPGNEKDVQTLFESITNLFADVVQYNKDNRFTPSPTSNITIDDLCLIMTDVALGEPLNRLAKVNDLMLQRSNVACLDFSYKNSVNPMKQISWNSSASEGGRQWMYQTCTEFGFYQTSSQETDLFGATLPQEYFIAQCSEIYGDMYNKKLLDKSIWRTNNMYGQLNIQASRVLFVHGSIDPWHALGITSSNYKRAPAIFIEGTAHCANMYPPSKHDLPQLTSARVKISKYIGKWLSDYEL